MLATAIATHDPSSDPTHSPTRIADTLEPTPHNALNRPPLILLYIVLETKESRLQKSYDLIGVGAHLHTQSVDRRSSHRGLRRWMPVQLQPIHMALLFSSDAVHFLQRRTHDT